jgi:hypothetical protein
MEVDIITVIEQPFKHSYRAIDQYLISNFLTFAKGFEVAITLSAAILFLLIAVGVAIRQAKRLPRSYLIEIIDLDGRLASVDGLRQTFSTYDAAESYARFYQKMYERQYRFKVVGNLQSSTQVRSTTRI